MGSVSISGSVRSFGGALLNHHGPRSGHGLGLGLGLGHGDPKAAATRGLVHRLGCSNLHVMAPTRSSSSSASSADSTSTAPASCSSSKWERLSSSEP